MSPLTEKRHNKTINVWFRAPALISVSLLAWVQTHLQRGQVANWVRLVGMQGRRRGDAGETQERRAGAAWNRHDEGCLTSALTAARSANVPSVLAEYGGLRLRFDLVPREVTLAKPLPRQPRGARLDSGVEQNHAEKPNDQPLCCAADSQRMP